MANQGQKLISSWVDERHKQRGAVVYIGWVVQRIRSEIRDLRVLTHVLAVARQSREKNMSVLDELIVELKRWEELPALMQTGLEPVRKAA